jgi:hypothetical protein
VGMRKHNSRQMNPIKTDLFSDGRILHRSGEQRLGYVVMEGLLCDRLTRFSEGVHRLLVMREREAKGYLTEAWLPPARMVTIVG